LADRSIDVPGLTVKRSRAVRKSKTAVGDSDGCAVALCSHVAEAVGAILGGTVGSDEPLMDAGLDSLGAVELRNSLATAVGVALPDRLVSDYPTVMSLAGFLSSQLADRSIDVPGLTDPHPSDYHIVADDTDQDSSTSGVGNFPNRVIVPLMGEAATIHSQIVDTLLAYDGMGEEDLSLDGGMKPAEASVLLRQLAHLAETKLAVLPMSISTSYPTAAALSQFLVSSASALPHDGERTDWARLEWECALFEFKPDAFPEQRKSGSERFQWERSWTREALHGLVCGAVEDISGIAGLDSSESLNDHILSESHTTSLRFELARLIGVVVLPPVFTSEYPSIDSVVDYLWSLIEGAQG